MKSDRHSKHYKALREWLAIKRIEDADETTRSIAEKLEIDQSVIVKIEVGRRKLDVIEYVKYCNALGVDPLEGIKIVQKSLKTYPEAQ